MTRTPVPYDGLSTDQTTHLVALVRDRRLVGARGATPLDALARYLFDQDDPAAFEELLRVGPLRGFGSPQAVLNGRLQLDELRRLKTASRRLMRTSTDQRERLGGIAGYFLAIALAQYFHDAWIAGRAIERARPSLLQFAEMAPEPYASLIREAVGQRAA